MLSLKDFKKFEVKSDGLKNVIGGINCNQIDDVLDAIIDDTANGIADVAIDDAANEMINESIDQSQLDESQDAEKPLLSDFEFKDVSQEGKGYESSDILEHKTAIDTDVFKGGKKANYKSPSNAQTTGVLRSSVVEENKNAPIKLNIKKKTETENVYTPNPGMAGIRKKMMDDLEFMNAQSSDSDKDKPKSIADRIQKRVNKIADVKKRRKQQLEKEE